MVISLAFAIEKRSPIRAPPGFLLENSDDLFQALFLYRPAQPGQPRFSSSSSLGSAGAGGTSD